MGPAAQQKLCGGHERLTGLLQRDHGEWRQYWGVEIGKARGPGATLRCPQRYGKRSGRERGPFVHLEVVCPVLDLVCAVPGVLAANVVEVPLQETSFA